LTLPETPRIAVIGLGYVGLPLAVAFRQHFPVVGLDVGDRCTSDAYRCLTADDFRRTPARGGIVFDLRDMRPATELPAAAQRHSI
jgi:hypothetical protein